MRTIAMCSNCDDDKRPSPTHSSKVDRCLPFYYHHHHHPPLHHFSFFLSYCIHVRLALLCALRCWHAVFLMVAVGRCRRCGGSVQIVHFHSIGHHDGASRSSWSAVVVPDKSRIRALSRDAGEFGRFETHSRVFLCRGEKGERGRFVCRRANVASFLNDDLLRQPQAPGWI
jgi:hypothetical protein